MQTGRGPALRGPNKTTSHPILRCDGIGSFHPVGALNDVAFRSVERVAPRGFQNGTAMKLFFSLLLIAGLASSAALNAGTIFFDAATHQLTPPAGVTFSSPDGTVVYDTKEGFGFIGVSGPGSNAEINEGQSLLLTFTSPQLFTDLTLGLLFDGDEFGDAVEIAGARVDGSLFQFTLTPNSSTTAIWNGPGSSVSNLSPAEIGFGGVWSVSNPFGGLEVNTLTLSPVPSGGTGSDFGLVRFSTTNRVPDNASTLGLLTLALIGFAFLSRRALR